MWRNTVDISLAWLHKALFYLYNWCFVPSGNFFLREWLQQKRFLFSPFQHCFSHFTSGLSLTLGPSTSLTWILHLPFSPPVQTTSVYCVSPSQSLHSQHQLAYPLAYTTPLIHSLIAFFIVGLGKCVLGCMLFKLWCNGIIYHGKTLVPLPDSC